MYFQSIVDDSVIVCDELISVSTNVTNTILTNVTSIVSIKSDDKEVIYKMGCYILHIHFKSPYYYLWWPLLGQNKKTLAN